MVVCSFDYWKLKCEPQHAHEKLAVLLSAPNLSFKQVWLKPTNWTNVQAIDFEITQIKGPSVFSVCSLFRHCLSNTVLGKSSFASELFITWPTQVTNRFPFKLQLPSQGYWSFKRKITFTISKFVWVIWECVIHAASYGNYSSRRGRGVHGCPVQSSHLVVAVAAARGVSFQRHRHTNTLRRN